MNRRSILFGAAVAALTACTLTGCATIGGASPALTAAKAMYLGEALYSAAKSSEAAAEQSGALNGQNLVTAEAVVTNMYTGLLIAREAYEAGTSPSISSLLSLTTDLLSLYAKLKGVVSYRPHLKVARSTNDLQSEQYNVLTLMNDLIVLMSLASTIRPLITSVQGVLASNDELTVKSSLSVIQEANDKLLLQS